MSMVWLKKYFLNWPAPVYVLLGSAFPVIYLYAHNVAETNFEEVVLPLVLSIAGAVVLWALLTLILRNARKAGLGTVIFLFCFFTYGHLCDGLDYLGLPVPRHAYFLPTMLFIWGYCVYFISRARRDFRTTTTLLNVVAVALIAINLFNIASHEIRLARLDTNTPGESPTQTPAASNLTELDTLPDIYFIILDEYANPDTMKEWYDYDDSEFFDSLEDKGFFIAHESKTRAHITPQCLAQILNMEYLTAGWYWDEDENEFRQIFSEELGPVDGPWDDATFRKVGYNKVMYFLKAQGYQYIVFGCQITRVRWHSYIEDTADLYLNYYNEGRTPWVTEFQDTLWRTTMLRPFYYHLVGEQYQTAWQRQTLYTLEHLKELSEVAGPKFVFVHFMCPHEPFVFGPNGEYIAPIDWRNYEDKQFYLGQCIFISGEIEEVVDALLEKSEIPPIIILQSDHGIRPMHPNIEIGGDEWRKILNAMYLPGMNYSEISPAISPVNTFRLIFNHYFGTNYTLLEND